MKGNDNVKGFKGLIVISAVISMLTVSAYAADTYDASYKIEMKDGIVSVTEDELYSEKDNSNLLVKVIKYIGDESTEIFSGKLKDYDGGKWVNTDFSEIQFMVIFDWDSLEDEAIYIIPQNDITSEGITLNPSVNEVENEVSENVVQSTTNVENITYDITYTVENGYMNIAYNVSNGASKEQTVTMIAALYKENLFQGLITEPLSLQAQETKKGYLALKLPETDLDKYKVRMMVWDSFAGMRPLGNAKTVNNIGGGLNEKTIILSSSANSEVKVFMNSETLVKNDTAEHIIKYNPQKLEPIDLCGFTYEKETGSGEIANTGITIKSVDVENGKIIYTFDMSQGRTTGINNFIKFKALTDLSGEEITYVIQ